MTIFGWFTIAVWAILAIIPGPEATSARILCLLMIIGTLVWGTGRL